MVDFNNAALRPSAAPDFWAIAEPSDAAHLLLDPQIALLPWTLMTRPTTGRELSIFGQHDVV